MEFPSLPESRPPRYSGQRDNPPAADSTLCVPILRLVCPVGCSQMKPTIQYRRGQTFREKFAQVKSGNGVKVFSDGPKSGTRDHAVPRRRFLHGPVYRRRRLRLSFLERIRLVAVVLDLNLGMPPPAIILENCVPIFSRCMKDWPDIIFIMLRIGSNCLTS